MFIERGYSFNKKKFLWYEQQDVFIFFERAVDLENTIEVTYWL